MLSDFSEAEIVYPCGMPPHAVFKLTGTSEKTVLTARVRLFRVFQILFLFFIPTQLFYLPYLFNLGFPLLDELRNFFRIFSS